MKTRIDEDYEAWERYPRHRWIFNKLELSLKLGYVCGPACVPVKHDGMYIVRPIYNLYGMSVSAKYVFLTQADKVLMEAHKFIDPGMFWCEMFDGPHYSIDYRWTDTGRGGVHSHWEPFNTTVGEKEDLKFTKWTKIENKYIRLPEWVDNFYDTNVINVEFIGDRIIEIHLRSGNDIVEDDPIGTTMIPIWSDTHRTEIDDLCEFGYVRHKNFLGDVYDASGYIDNPRIGYLKRIGEGNVK
tara:strand:- start:12733 stop:13455 length:723 start_codon:yes stop_codon:yes gene_type:complete